MFEELRKKVSGVNFIIKQVEDYPDRVVLRAENDEKEIAVDATISELNQLQPEELAAHLDDYINMYLRGQEQREKELKAQNEEISELSERLKSLGWK